VAVDSKSTAVLDRFPFLFRDVFFDHRVRDGPQGDYEVTLDPQVPAPELLQEVGDFLERHTKADPFQSSDNRADALVRMIDDQEVYIGVYGLPLKDFMFHRNLPEEVPDSKGNWPHEHRFPGLPDPDKVGFAL
jgi:hypothetical protein